MGERQIGVIIMTRRKKEGVEVQGKKIDKKQKREK